MKHICFDKNRCTGCTACESICPKKCIKMKESSEGFLYPTINEEICIDCGLCIKTCPVNQIADGKNQIADKYFIKAGYIVRIKDTDLISRCTSGGAFTAMANYVLDQKGIVYGAIYDDSMNVIHQRISTKSHVTRLPGSKYVQSDISGIFAKVQLDILDGYIVLFCGTPCQVAGLVAFLGKKPSNLFLVDLVCHGVPSPKLWNKYLKYQEEKYGKLVYSNFRSKYYGYHVTVMEERYKSGKLLLGSARTNMMLKCYFKNAADRESCYNCSFKTIERMSDLTIFDCWHAGKINPELKDDTGYTSVIVQSENGKKLLLACSNLLDIYSADIQTLLKLDGTMVMNSVCRPIERDLFYKKLNGNSIAKVVNDLFPITKKDQMIEKSKDIFHKVGILSLIKSLKKN